MIVSTVLGFVTGLHQLDVPQVEPGTAASGMTGAQVAERVLASNGSQARRDGHRRCGPSACDPADRRQPHRQLRPPRQDAQPVRGRVRRRAWQRPASRRTRPATRCRTPGYVWGRDPHALVPAANFGSQAAWMLIIVGFFSALHRAWARCWSCSASRSSRVAVLFQLVTLPVEFDASRRAMGSLEARAALPPSRLPARGRC